MKEVSFAQLPFTIADSYRTMKKKKKSVILFQKYLAKMNVYRDFFHMVVEFELEECKKENYEEIQSLLIKEYGQPFAVLLGNLMAWKKEGFYIIHGFVEKMIGDKEVHILRIRFHLPFGKKLDYSTYLRVGEVFQRLKTEHQFSEQTSMMFMGGVLMVWLQSENRSYLIEMKKKTYGVYILKAEEEKDGTHFIPYRKKIGAYRSLDDIYSQIHEFLLQVKKEEIEKKGSR